MRIVLNLPWDILGFILALTCLPRKFNCIDGMLAIETRNIWFLKKTYVAQCWHRVVIHKTGAIYSLPHERVHTEQYERYWGFFLLFYCLETIRHGYHNNRFEKEARERSGL